MVKGIKNGKRRNYRTVDEKVAMLRRHIVDKVPVSDLCDEYAIVHLLGRDDGRAQPSPADVVRGTLTRAGTGRVARVHAARRGSTDYWGIMSGAPQARG